MPTQLHRWEPGFRDSNRPICHAVTPLDYVGIALTYRIRANRATVLSIWAAYSFAFFLPALMSGPLHLLGMAIATLASATMASLALRATIKVKAGDRLTIRYLIHSLTVRLENIEVVPTPRFDFRRHRKLGVKRLYQGTRLPGFHAGWFVLRNGSVAFVCVSRKRKASAFKTHNGCYILVDPRIARRIRNAADASVDPSRARGAQ